MKDGKWYVQACLCNYYHLCDTAITAKSGTALQLSQQLQLIEL